MILQRIALTGSSGFLGAAIRRRLQQDRHCLRLLQRSPTPSTEPESEAIAGSLEDAESLKRLVAGCDVVIHCAGLTAAADPADFHRVNAQGTARLAAAARDAGVGRFLLISSLSARLPELSPYAASKRAAEDLLAAMPGLAWDALRPTAIYGPGDLHLLSLLRPLAAGFALMPAGPLARASVIHVDEVAHAVAAWLAGPPPAGVRYELDDGAGARGWRQLLEIAAGQLQVKPRYLTPPAPLLAALAWAAEAWARRRRQAPFLTAGKLREMQHPDWSADAGPFQAATAWRPHLGFEAGLRETLAWYEAEGFLPRRDKA